MHCRGSRRFAITAAGQDALTAWVARVDERANTRDALLVRVRAAAAVGPSHVRDVVASYLVAHQRALDTYREIEERDFAAGESVPATALLHLVLRRGVEMEESWVGWCQEVLAVVDSAGFDLEVRR